MRRLYNQYGQGLEYTGEVLRHEMTSACKIGAVNKANGYLRWLLPHAGRFNDDVTTGLPYNKRFPFKIDRRVCAVLADTVLVGKVSAAGVAEANRFGPGRATS